MPWLMAAVYDRFMRRTEALCLADWRAELLREARGRVLDVGAGTGANLPHYPAGLERLVLAEPDPHMRARLQTKLASYDLPAELSDAPLEALPFADDSFDTVVATLVLCTVDDPQASVAEICRVLTPGGRLLFLEHVASDDPSRLRWQHRLEPLWKLVAGGCCVTRQTAETLQAHGLTIERCESASMRKAPAIVRPTIRGVARLEKRR